MNWLWSQIFECRLPPPALAGPLAKVNNRRGREKLPIFHIDLVLCIVPSFKVTLKKIGVIVLLKSPLRKAEFLHFAFSKTESKFASDKYFDCFLLLPLFALLSHFSFLLSLYSQVSFSPFFLFFILSFPSVPFSQFSLFSFKK